MANGLPTIVEPGVPNLSRRSSWRLDTLDAQRVTLDQYLLSFAPKSCQTSPKMKFIPPGVLRALFSRDRVENRLKEIAPRERREADLQLDVDRICRSSKEGESWLKIYAILY